MSGRGAAALRRAPRALPLVLLAALPGAAAAQEATLQGRVHDEDGAAIYAATVLLERDDAVVVGTGTDRLGSFRLAPLEAGTYTLRIGALGYAEYSEEVVLGPGMRVDLEVLLERSVIALPGLSVEAAASR
ncbi:MAG TPA: carboxypeptidase-like regulatory domain-containing protein, partial [Longimicrobiales bacterium]|nr:carboxypeptidase-like regulatory domain-containing protein [Longimicrobiales bacterium]